MLRKLNSIDYTQLVYEVVVYAFTTIWYGKYVHLLPSSGTIGHSSEKRA